MTKKKLKKTLMTSILFSNLNQVSSVLILSTLEKLSDQFAELIALMIRKRT